MFGFNTKAGQEIDYNKLQTLPIGKVCEVFNWVNCPGIKAHGTVWTIKGDGFHPQEKDLVRVSGLYSGTTLLVEKLEV